MKKRITSLVLVLSLLLSMLIPGSLAFAEDPAQPAAEEAIETEFVEEEPAGDEPAIEEEVPPEEEAPAEGEPAEVEVPPQEEATVDGEPSVEEDPPVEEEPAEGEAPVEGEEPALEEPLEGDVQLQEIDLTTWPALGSKGEQYEGVRYLSQAAFNSMPEDAQKFYLEKVDELHEMLGAGVPIPEAVFFLKSDGTVGLGISLTTQFLAENAASLYEIEDTEELPIGVESIPEGEIPDEAAGEEVPDEEPSVEEAPDMEKLRPSESVSEEFPSVLPENEEWAEERMHPLDEHPAGGSSSNIAILNGAPELQEINTLFWNNKDFFYKKLSSVEKNMFKAAKDFMLDHGLEYFNYKAKQKLTMCQIMNATSAFLDTYPYTFDFVNWGMPIEEEYFFVEYRPSEKKYFAQISFYRWQLSGTTYQSMLAQAQSKVVSLVNDAYKSAQANYPNDIPYGIVRYFDDWICRNNYYNTYGITGNRATDTFYYCHCSFGILLKGYGVCESYALAMTRLLDAAGIPNLYVLGYVYNDPEDGGHAWNYVQMPNKKYYLQDSTFNDTSGQPQGLSARDFLLCASDARENGRVATGQKFKSGSWGKPKKFSFVKLSNKDYKPSDSGSLIMSKTNVYLTKGKSETLATSGDYYKNFKITWSNSDDSVAALKNGKITAKKPGKTVVTQSYNGTNRTCNVYVYEFTGLGFVNNSEKSSYTLEHTSGLNKSTSVSIKVKQKSYDATAQSIRAAKDIAKPTVSVDKKGKSVVDPDSLSATLTGNNILLTFIPRKLGNATITVKFAGKSAKLTLHVRQQLQSGWFYLADKTNETYSGKAIKPPVKLADSAPEGLKKDKDYSVSYENVTNAWGTHKVIIKGKGNYGGTIEKTFTIRQASIDSSKLKITNAKAQTYNGAALTAKPTIKLGSKTLKAGVDYEIRYNGSTSAPSSAGSYTLTFVGKNYSGNFSDGETHKFVIKPVALSKLKISMSTSVKASGSRVSPTSLKLKLKSGKKEISSSNYNVSYQDSKHNTISAPYEPGTYYVVITARGSNIDTSNKDSLTKKFTIKK